MELLITLKGKQLSKRLKNLSVIIGALAAGWGGVPVHGESPDAIPAQVVPLDILQFKEILDSDDIPILVLHRQDPNALRPNESLQTAPRQATPGSEVARNLLGTPRRMDIAGRRAPLRQVASTQNRAAFMIGDMFGGGTTSLSLTHVIGDVIPYASAPAAGTQFNSFVGFDHLSGAAQGPLYAGMTDSANHFPLLTTIGIDTNNDNIQDTFPNLLQYHFPKGPDEPGKIEDNGPFSAVFTGGKTVTTPNGDTVPVLQLEQKLSIADLPSPSQGGGVVGRVKIGENTSPMPRDRVFFNYSYFNGVPLTPGGTNINRFTPGFEKTIQDGNASIEFRAPFATTLSSNLNATGITDGEDLQFGNASLTYKSLIYSDDEILVSAGLQTEIPTGNAVNVNLADGTTIVRLKNEAVHLMPFAGALYTPTERFFSQAFVQFDVAANTNHVLTNLDRTKLRRVGTIDDTTFVYLDWSMGYWAYLADEPSAFMTGVAPIFELHLNQSLEKSDTLRAPGNFRIGTSNSNVSNLNAVIGTTFQFGAQSALTAAYVTPVGGGADQQFNGEFRLFFNRRFGPQTIQSRAF